MDDEDGIGDLVGSCFGYGYLLSYLLGLIVSESDIIYSLI